MSDSGHAAPKTSIFDSTIELTASMCSQMFDAPKNRVAALFLDQRQRRTTMEGLQALQQASVLLYEMETALNSVTRDDFAAVSRMRRSALAVRCSWADRRALWMITKLHFKQGSWPKFVYVYVINPTRLRNVTDHLLFDAKVEGPPPFEPESSFRTGVSYHVCYQDWQDSYRGTSCHSSARHMVYPRRHHGRPTYALFSHGAPTHPLGGQEPVPDTDELPSYAAQQATDGVPTALSRPLSVHQLGAVWARWIPFGEKR
jgi:hypothetical protein